jgi:thymidine phosphorylase
MLVLGGLARDHAEAVARVDRALASGAAAERLARMVAALGGPADLVERHDRHLVEAPVRLAVAPEHAGVISRVDARSIGLALTRLGVVADIPGMRSIPPWGSPTCAAWAMRWAGTGPSRWFTRDPRPMRKWRRWRSSAP